MTPLSRDASTTHLPRAWGTPAYSPSIPKWAATNTGPAAAMAVLIAGASLLVTVLYLALGKLVEKRTQAWRNPAR